MPTFLIEVSRIYAVSIEAESLQDAIVASTLLETRDGSWEAERNEGHFKIGEIEIIKNESFLVD